MKKNIFLLFSLILLFTIGVKAQGVTAPAATTTTTAAPAEPKKAASLAEIKFEKEDHDFGTVANGGNGVTEFKFTNTGKEPLVITNARGSCGCTVPDWPKEPIKPGASSAIKVSYDTKRVGPFTKTVTVTHNTNSETTILTIHGTIEAPVKEETFPAKKTEDGSTPLAVPVKSKF